MKLNLFYAALLSPALLYLSACGSDASDSSGANRTPPQAEDGHDDHEDGSDEEHESHDEADGDDHEGHEEGGGHTEHEGEGGDHVELTAEEAEAAGIRTGRAQTGAVSGQLELPAEIRFDADRVARVSPQVEGTVAQLYAGEGDIVKAGATLARLTSRELAGLKADYLNALSASRKPSLSVRKTSGSRKSPPRPICSRRVRHSPQPMPAGKLLKTGFMRSALVMAHWTSLMRLRMGRLHKPM